MENLMAGGLQTLMGTEGQVTRTEVKTPSSSKKKTNDGQCSEALSRAWADARDAESKHSAVVEEYRRQIGCLRAEKAELLKDTRSQQKHANAVKSWSKALTKRLCAKGSSMVMKA